jgi:hypothetical protein
LDVERAADQREHAAQVETTAREAGQRHGGAQSPATKQRCKLVLQSGAKGQANRRARDRGDEARGRQGQREVELALSHVAGEAVLR